MIERDKIHIKNIFKSFAPLVMLGVYFVFLTFQNIGIVLERADHAHEICTPELELDSCHRHVFHNDDIKGCDHKDHIHSPKDQQLLLTAVVSPHEFAEYILLDDCFVQPIKQNSFSTHQYILNRLYLSHYFRGPPSLV
jgi:hypothetical protein